MGIGKLGLLADRDTRREIFSGLRLLAVSAVGFLLRNRPAYDDLWIISERIGEARDNGYRFFQYIMDNNLHENTWYVMNFNSPDYALTAPYRKNIIKACSLMHHLYFCLSSRSISTQLSFAAPGILPALKLKGFMPVKKKYVYLGHGICKDDVGFLYKKKAKIDLFIADNRMEMKAYIEKAGYAPGEVALTGRPRNDGLSDYTKEDIILIMPTNRIWFPQNRGPVSEAGFIETQFFKEYQDLLDSQELVELLDKTGFRLQFYLHTNTQQYAGLFTPGSGRMEITCSGAMGVREALQKAAVLVTDYSSVSFDFAYMGKPVVYFQFDYERFRQDQYNEGWFSFKKNGPGRIAADREGLIKELRHLFDSGLVQEEQFRKRADVLYEFRDDDNSKRVYERILGMGAIRQKTRENDRMN